MKKFIRLLHWLRFNILFFVLFIAMTAIFMNGFSELNQIPIGVHAWKLSLHFSMIQNYIDGSAGFWHPAINNLFNFDHTGNLIQEFPIFNQIAAWLVLAFSFLSPTVFRWMMFLLSMIGFYHIYRLNLLILKKNSLSMVSTFLVASMPIIVYYGSNFLVDVPALLFAFSSVYFLERNINIKSNWNIVAAAFFLLLAGLLRLPVILPLLSYACIRLLYKKRMSDFLWLLPSIVLIAVWYLYVSKYNTYWISVPPMDSYWNLSPEKISEVNKLFIDNLVPQLGWAYKYAAFYITVIALLSILWKRVSKFWMLVLIINLIGSLIYFVLWYGLFSHHDYYLIPILSNFVLIWINILYAVREIKIKYFIGSLCIIVLCLNSMHTYNNIRVRTYKPCNESMNFLSSKYENDLWAYYAWDFNMKFKVIYDISPYSGSSFLKDHCITSKDSVICDFDYSPIVTLSVLQLKGWTLYNSDFKTIDEYTKFVNAGAHFLICDTINNNLIDSNSIALLKTNRIFSIGNIEGYDIRHLKK